MTLRVSTVPWQPRVRSSRLPLALTVFGGVLVAAESPEESEQGCAVLVDEGGEGALIGGIVGHTESFFRCGGARLNTSA